MKAIWAKEGRAIQNRTLAFVYEYKGENADILVKLAASNVFRMFLNGRLVGYGPRRSAHGYSNINNYHFLLSAGERFVIEVAGYCINSFYIVDELPFFACELYNGDELIADAASFQCYEVNDRLRRIQRFSFQRPFAEAYNMKQDRGAFYGGADIFPAVETCEVTPNILQECDLPYPDFGVSKSEPIEWGRVGKAENPLIYRDRSIDEICDDLKGYKYEELEAKISDEACSFSYVADGKKTNSLRGRYVLYDFSRVVTGFVSCKVEVAKECDLYFTFDEILMHEVYDNPHWGPHFSRDCLPLVFFRMATCNVIKYTLAPGTYNLLAFEPYNMRYLKVTCARGDAKIEAPEIVRYENPDVYRSEFVSADPDLNKIFYASQHTLAQNAVDVLTDCPNRERAGWLCDSYFSGRVERLLTGENRVERNLLDALIKAPALPQLPEGMIPMCYPSDHYNGMYIPNWAMWYVIELEDYTRRCGSDEFAMRSKNKIYDLLRCFERFENEDGLLENLESWVCVEHSKAAEFVQNVSYPTNMLYAKMFDCIYRLYGDEKAKERSQEIAETVRKQSFNGTFFEDNRVREDGVLKQTGNTTETCQYYAFFTGVATKERYPALYETMLHKFGPARDTEKVYPNVYPSNAFIGNYLRLLYFYSCGEKVEVFEECRAYFLYMANRTLTLWEHDKAHASCDHAFASYPAIFIINCLTGFVRADVSAKKIYFEKPAVKLDCSVRIPIGKNDTLTIQMKDGRAIICDLPAGYTAVEGE